MLRFIPHTFWFTVNVFDTAAIMTSFASTNEEKLRLKLNHPACINVKRS